MRSKNHILCVDDTPSVLATVQECLHERYDVTVAGSGKEALRILAGHGDIAVILCDLGMPEMDGTSFLRRARGLSPNSTRVLMSGHPDLRTVIQAINEGHIFRFLDKPLDPKELMHTIDAAAARFEFVALDRDLAENTLKGSLKLVTEILGLVKPEAFGRALRLKRLVGMVLPSIDEEMRWEVEIAAMLSQVGYISIPPDTLMKLYQNKTLSMTERRMVDKLPAVTDELLANIPRLEGVREILLNRHAPFDPASRAPGVPSGSGIPLGARILRIVSDYEILEMRSENPASALGIMDSRKGAYDPNVLSTFRHALGNHSEEGEIADVPCAALQLGMVFLDDVRSKTGALLVPRGQEVTGSVLARIRNFSARLGVREPFKVRIPFAPEGEECADTSRAGVS